MISASHQSKSFNTGCLFLPLYFQRINLPAAIISLHALFVLQISEAVSKNQFDRAVRKESEFIIECELVKLIGILVKRANQSYYCVKVQSFIVTRQPQISFLKAFSGQAFKHMSRKIQQSFIKDAFRMSLFPLGVDSFRKLLRINCSDPSSNRGNQARDEKRLPFYGGKSFWTIWISLIHQDFSRSF